MFVQEAVVPVAPVTERQCVSAALHFQAGIVQTVQSGKAGEQQLTPFLFPIFDDVLQGVKKWEDKAALRD